MSASRFVKAEGVPSVRKLAKWLEVSERRLYRWYHKQPQVLRAVCLGYMRENHE